jgi:predicted nucleic acid-binding protein
MRWEQIGRAEIPDMPDRIIAATAVCLGVPLVMRDGKIRASAVRTIPA